MGVKRNVTSRFGRTDIFTRRLVITIPRSGALLIAVGIAFGIIVAAKTVLFIVAFIVSVVSVAAVIEARHQLRNFRYEVKTRIDEMVEASRIPDDVDLREIWEELESAESTIIRLPK